MDDNKTVVFVNDKTNDVKMACQIATLQASPP